MGLSPPGPASEASEWRSPGGNPSPAARNLDKRTSGDTGAGTWGDSLGAISHIKLSQGASPVSLAPPLSLLVGFSEEWRNGAEWRGLAAAGLFFFTDSAVGKWTRRVGFDFSLGVALVLGLVCFAGERKAILGIAQAIN